MNHLASLALSLAPLSQIAPWATAVLRRNNVQVTGEGKPPLLLCNGFGCNLHIWNYLLPALAVSHQVIRFDQVGTGESDLTAYDPVKYATLAGYAQDVVEICQALDLREAIIVGHSAGAMIGLLAAVQAPEHFAKAVLLAASPCYVNEPGYYGGFERADVLEVLASMESNYYSWAGQFANLLIGPGYAASVGEELTGYFCQADSEIARQFARVAYLTDSRAAVPHLQLPTLLIQLRRCGRAGRGRRESARAFAPGATRDLTGHRSLPAPERPARNAGRDAGFLNGCVGRCGCSGGRPATYDAGQLAALLGPEYNLQHFR
ncbi:MAG: alpha/beta fold hydrolase [Janthinobacterium lividum]